MSRAPLESPSHHVTQIGPASDQRASPASSRLVTPIVALTAVARPAPRSAKRITPCGRSNAVRPPAQRLMRRVASTASSVLPIAIPTVDGRSPEVVRLTAKAPTKIAGHSSGPINRSEAIARPVGGQTAVALALTNASVRPNLPATK